MRLAPLLKVVKSRHVVPAPESADDPLDILLCSMLAGRMAYPEVERRALLLSPANAL